jgi:hypothetical protein
MKKEFLSLSIITVFACALTFAGCKKKEEAPPPPPPPASAPAPEPTPPPASDVKPDTPAPDKAPGTKKGGAEG